MDIAETAKVLNDLYAQQYKDNLAANEKNRVLADEQISYNNEARGTYYSGIPTWERAQNAVTYANKANDINLNFANQRTKLWNTISDYMDRINAYNEAGSGGNGNGGNGGNGGDGSTIWDYGNGYTLKGTDGGDATYYKDGKQISAGEFLSNTGANWKNWNDVWKKGVKTRGVGSDTIDIFQNRGNEDLSTYENYKYLFKR